jgi:hypothetical protein
MRHEPPYKDKYHTCDRSPYANTNNTKISRVRYKFKQHKNDMRPLQIQITQKRHGPLQIQITQNDTRHYKYK